MQAVQFSPVCSRYKRTLFSRPLSLCPRPFAFSSGIYRKDEITAISPGFEASLFLFFSLFSSLLSVVPHSFNQSLPSPSFRPSVFVVVLSFILFFSSIPESLLLIFFFPSFSFHRLSSLFFFSLLFPSFLFHLHTPPRNFFRSIHFRFFTLNGRGHLIPRQLISN